MRGRKDKNGLTITRSALVLFTEASRERLKALHPASRYADVTRRAITEYKAMGSEALAEWSGRKPALTTGCATRARK